jgi:hypothetical protein
MTSLVPKVRPFLVYFQCCDIAIQQSFHGIMISFSSESSLNFTVRHEESYPGLPIFYDFADDSRNLSIVTVRGTHDIFDMVMDVDLWLEVLMLQVCRTYGNHSLAAFLSCTSYYSTVPAKCFIIM